MTRKSDALLSHTFLQTAVTVESKNVLVEDRVFSGVKFCSGMFT